MASKMRFLAYAGTSVLLTVGVVMLALIDRPNFYSACVAISQNSASMIIIINTALVFTLVFGKAVQLLFFGPLRALELEHLYERLWFALTETGLAMTIFKDSFSYQFAFMFTILMFLRVFHWIASDRVNLIFQTAGVPTWQQRVRLGLALFVIILCDGLLTRNCTLKVLERGPGIHIMFAFEFALLLNSILASSGKYLLNLVELEYLQNHPEEDAWEPKTTGLLVLEVATDSLSLVIYTMFFVMMLQPFGLPLHIARDVYLTVTGLVGRIRDYVRFRRASLQLDRNAVNATAQEIQDAGEVCIICRDNMDLDGPPTNAPKKLACGHIIHFKCLKSWLERSQRCPTCRSPVLDEGNGDNNNTNNTNNNNNDNRQNFGNAAQPRLPQQQQQQNQEQAPIDGPQNNNNAGEAREVEAGQATNQNTQGAQVDDTRPILMHRGFAMPEGWTAVRAQAAGGEYKVLVERDKWATLLQGATSASTSTSTSTSTSRGGPTISSNENPLAEQLSRLEQKVDGLDNRMAETLDAVHRLQSRLDALEGVTKDVSAVKGKRKVYETEEEGQEEAAQQPT